VAVEILTFLALGLVLEGVLFALLPGIVSRSLREMANWSPDRLRRVGIMALVAGVLALTLLAMTAGDGGGLAFAFPRLRGAFGLGA
jgi:uncharacterized protein YjeT (DUF2065 family)